MFDSADDMRHGWAYPKIFQALDFELVQRQMSLILNYF